MSETGAALQREVQRAFGVENRRHLLRIYLSEVDDNTITPETAWKHVYGLLLWIDRTIGLAHCYESDKAQPGRPWYARSLRFHKWLSDQLGVEPRLLALSIDWLFSAAVRDLSSRAAQKDVLSLERAATQRLEYQGVDMPEPNEDPDLERLVSAAITEELAVDVPGTLPRTLIRVITEHLATENKRKNLVGEGFEDTLAALLEQWAPVRERFDIFVRPRLHDLAGFHEPRGTDKTKRVDLALVERSSGQRVLVSCKWSVRSDREEQFRTDFDAYSSLERTGARFVYVLMTNEFDPARLAAACESRSGNSPLFDHVVHVNTEGVKEALSATSVGSDQLRSGHARTVGHMASGRLMSLGHWMQLLAAP